MPPGKGEETISGIGLSGTSLLAWRRSLVGGVPDPKAAALWFGYVLRL